MTKKIFISYARSDYEIVKRIVDRIEQDLGLQCWMDIEGIESDEENFVKNICRAIDQSEVLLFFVSYSSIKSNWTLKEINYARQKNKRIVPIVFDEVKLDGAFLFDFSQSNIIDIRNSLQQKKLFDDISKWFSLDFRSNAFETIPIKKREKGLYMKYRFIIGLCILALIIVGLFIYMSPSVSTKNDTPPNLNINLSDTTSIQTFTVDSITFKMVYVEGGTFMMGATKEQEDVCTYPEKPQHKVTIPSFMIGQTEVTQELWDAVMSKNTSDFKGKRKPVDNLSWEDCERFLHLLKAFTGIQFRFPTEAEWEYAARGGRKSKGYRFSGSNNVGEVSWYSVNSRIIENDSAKYYGPHEVALKNPNELGLYDMSGNVSEWCLDFVGNDYYSESVSINPQGPQNGTEHIRRGGAWNNPANCQRVSHRGIFISRFTTNNAVGLRLAL